MKALGIAILILIGLVVIVIGLIVLFFLAVSVVAFLPLVVGIPLGIWVDRYSTGLGVAIILTSVVIEVVWAAFLNR